jgi:hypothetical protein
MNWQKAPSLIRELRIAYIIPELRVLVAKNIGLCFIRWIYEAMCLVIIAPILCIGITGQLLATLGEWLGEKVDPIWKPSRWLRDKELANLEMSHTIVPVKEIRRRVYNEYEPEILPK